MKKIIVVLMAFCFTLILLLPVFLTAYDIPKNTINMMVGHYYEDYYEYLSFVSWGQKGNFFISNLFTNNDPGRYLIPWWPYVFLGFGTYFMQIPVPPQVVYWSASFFFCFILAILIYLNLAKLLKDYPWRVRLISFLAVLTASPWFNFSWKEKIEIIPYNYWYAAGSPFARFNIGTPHHQIAQIIFLLGLLWAGEFKEKSKGKVGKFALLSVLLFSVSFPLMLVFWLSFGIIGISFKRVALLKLVGGVYLVGGLALSFFYLLLIKVLGVTPVHQGAGIWDSANIYFPPLILFILVSGPILFLGILGMPIYLKRLTYTKSLYLAVTIISFTAILTTPLKSFWQFLGIHNLRFTTVGSYILLGAAAALLLHKIIKNKFLYLLAGALFISSSLPSFITFWQEAKKGPITAGYMQYMPETIYQGLKFIGGQKDDSTVLTSSTSSLGLVVPALSQKKVYMGRSIFTPDLKERISEADKFYGLKMDKKEAIDFMEKEKIGYVLALNLDANRNKLEKTYPFLKSVYNTYDLAIFKVEK
jgi:hypothetical protein